jgi:uncharacterized membrane protein YraQ (UPF0718 family)
MTTWLLGVTLILLAASFLADRRRTLEALRIALRRFLKVALPFLFMLVLIAVFIVLVPESLLISLLGRENPWKGLAAAIPLGTISAMPGFIAYPLCGILLSRGAAYMVLSGFSASLMMVGFVTFPLERRYLGWKLALARNIASLLLALVVAIATGLVFGEIL